MMKSLTLSLCAVGTLGFVQPLIADEDALIRVIELDGEECEVGPEEVREFLEEHAPYAVEEFDESIEAAEESMDEFAELMEEHNALEKENPEQAKTLLEIKKLEHKHYTEVYTRIENGENPDAVALDLEAQWKTLAILRLRFEKQEIQRHLELLNDDLAETEQLIKYPERIIRDELKEIREEMK